MYFKSSLRYDSQDKTFHSYYRLMESYRNEVEIPTKRTLLNIGIWKEVTPEQLNKIRYHLNLREDGQTNIFAEEDEFVIFHTNRIWNELLAKGKIDSPQAIKDKQSKLIYEETLTHKDAKSIGSEYICSSAYKQLGIASFLETLGWNQAQIQLTETQIVSRAVHPASELETARWIKENSAICDITQYPSYRINKDKLYRNALALYQIKDELEQHLSIKTNELFDIEDKIVLFDLTNTYFEGKKENSKLAQFGRGKEKRSDAKIVVLALVTNRYGFIKYSNIFEGNTSDSSTLPDIVDHLRVKTSTSERAIVVLDAGIATEQNLALLVAKGYDYVCVNRVKLKDYKSVANTTPTTITTRNSESLAVEKVSTPSNTDYYLKVKSTGKTLKEASMLQQFEERFLLTLNKIKKGISQKHTVKTAEAINRRIGRNTEKYPTVARYFKIELQTNDQGKVQDITWQKDEAQYNKRVQEHGVYFVRTNLPFEQEQLVWDTYNTIREIESVFRTLKTDLDLRPIYHKNDSSTMAHLHLGLLAYWLVNTVRHQLKGEAIKHSWKEVVRIGDTQHLVTTTAQNIADETLTIKKCTEPIESLYQIYKALKIPLHPLGKTKSVGHKIKRKKIKPQCLVPS